MPEIKEKTKKELLEEIDALKAELKKQLEEKKYLAQNVESKDKRIADMESDNGVTLEKAEKRAEEAEKELENLKTEYGKVLAFSNRRTNELEEMINLFASYEQLMNINAELVRKAKDELIKRIQS